MKGRAESTTAPDLRVRPAARARRALVLVAAATVAGILWISAIGPRGERPTIDQGAYGYIVLAEGNCMPVAPPNCETRTRVARTLWFCEPVPWDAVGDETQLSGFRILAQASSSETGFYQAHLAPGNYSVLVEDGGRASCGRSQDGVACPLKIGPGLTRQDVLINHVSW